MSKTEFDYEDFIKTIQPLISELNINLNNIDEEYFHKYIHEFKEKVKNSKDNKISATVNSLEDLAIIIYILSKTPNVKFKGINDRGKVTYEIL